LKISKGVDKAVNRRTDNTVSVCYKPGNFYVFIFKLFFKCNLLHRELLLTQKLLNLGFLAVKCRSLFVLLYIFPSHCVVCSSSIYGFWLPFWYLQTLHWFSVTVAFLEYNVCSDQRTFLYGNNVSIFTENKLFYRVSW
jgi:hypothetical protein